MLLLPTAFTRTFRVILLIRPRSTGQPRDGGGKARPRHLGVFVRPVRAFELAQERGHVIEVPASTEVSAVELTKEFGQTKIVGQEYIDEPVLHWPKR